MFKQLGITTVALAGLLAFAAPKKADARVHFGVYVGGPAYTYAPPVPVDPYGYGYAPDYGYYNAPAPAYVAPPAYVDPYYYGAPSYGFGFGWGHDRDHWRHEEHEEHERFEHGFRGGEHHGGWRR